MSMGINWYFGFQYIIFQMGIYNFQMCYYCVIVGGVQFVEC